MLLIRHQPLHESILSG
jgi:hypothetical protein